MSFKDLLPGIDSKCLQGKIFFFRPEFIFILIQIIFWQGILDFRMNRKIHKFIKQNIFKDKKEITNSFNILSYPIIGIKALKTKLKGI